MTYKRNFGIISTESGDKFPVYKHRSAVHLHVTTSWFASRRNRADFRKLLQLIFCHFSAVSRPIELIFSVLDTDHIIWCQGCQSGVVETSTPVTSEVWVRFPVEAGLYVIDRIEWTTLSDSVGLLRPPVSSYRATKIAYIVQPIGP